MVGCGKSTLAKKLAEKYRFKYLSGGNALKTLAIEIGYKPGGMDWWETQDGTKFLEQRMNETKFDMRVDKKLIELTEQGNVVLDSWTMPWLLNEGFKMWLEASPKVRAERIAQRDSISFERAFKVLNARDEKTEVIYKRLYGFNIGKDFSPFNIILDANELDADEVFHVICMIIDRLYIKKI